MSLFPLVFLYLCSYFLSLGSLVRLSITYLKSIEIEKPSLKTPKNKLISAADEGCEALNSHMEPEYYKHCTKHLRKKSSNRIEGN